jgi:DNA-binding NtrC family response regulator
MAIATPSVVVLDDDSASIREINQALRPKYTVLATGDWRKAVQWLETDRSVTLFIVNQGFRSMGWSDILKEVRQLRPHIRRVLRTPYSDLTAIVPSLHNGDINLLVSKPLLAGDLQSLLAINQAA